MKDWFEEWLNKGNEIAGSSYYDEKMCVDSYDSSAITAKHRQRVKRRTLNHYIIDRSLKKKYMSRFIIDKLDYGWSVNYMPWGAPVYLKVSPKYHPAKEHHHRGWGYDLDDMLDTYGRILPRYVYIKKSNSFMICVSPMLKRYIKRSCNHYVRTYTGEISRGRYFLKLTSRLYQAILF